MHEMTVKILSTYPQIEPYDEDCWYHDDENEEKVENRKKPLKLPRTPKDWNEAQATEGYVRAA